MDHELHQSLKTVFGYEQFRPSQLEIIKRIISGRDCFVLMPTGGGKSLCYQVPALHRAGTAIVVSPLISLMKDQVDTLRAYSVKAAYYNSSLSGNEAREVLSAFHDGSLDLLYIAPERLMSEDFMSRLSEIEIALFAIDAAHCISQWGHDFRPEYRKLGNLRGRFAGVPIVALTATAEAHTREDIIERLHLDDAQRFITGSDRPNIRYLVQEKVKPLDQFIRFLDSWKDQAGIIYCRWGEVIRTRFSSSPASPPPALCPAGLQPQHVVPAGIGREDDETVPADPGRCQRGISYRIAAEAVFRASAGVAS